MKSISQSLLNLLLAISLALAITACGDSEKKDDAGAQDAPITEDNALERADDIIKDIEEL